MKQIVFKKPMGQFETAEKVLFFNMVSYKVGATSSPALLTGGDRYKTTKKRGQKQMFISNIDSFFFSLDFDNYTIENNKLLEKLGVSRGRSY